MILATTSPVHAQGTVRISGTVIEEGTDAPIPLVNVVVRRTTIGAATDTMGRFSIEVPIGDSCIVSFSHLAYEKIVRSFDTRQPKHISVRQRLEPTTFRLPDVVIQRTRFEDMRTYNVLDAKDFEKLGEPKLEQSLRYFMPFLIKPLRERMFDDSKDFTLYVDDVWYESIYLNDFNPFAIRRVAVWGALWSPIGYPAVRGGHVVAIWTKDAK